MVGISRYYMSIITTILFLRGYLCEENVQPENTIETVISPPLPNRSNFNLGVDEIANFYSIVKEKVPSIKRKSPWNVTMPPMEDVFYHARVGAAARCSFHDQFKWSCTPDCSYFKILRGFFNPTIDAYALVGLDKDRKEIIVNHRESNGNINRKSLANYELIHMPNTPEGVQIHKGMHEVYRANADPLNQYIKELLADKYKDHKLIILGYSLGAAIATLHAADLAPTAQDKGIQMEVYPFNSMRVGNDKFAEYITKFQIPMVRYTNSGDLASHFPPRHLGYRHIPGEIYTPPASSKDFVPYVVCDLNYDEDPDCILGGSKKISIYDHLKAFGTYPQLCRYDPVKYFNQVQNNQTHSQSIFNIISSY